MVVVSALVLATGLHASATTYNTADEARVESLTNATRARVGSKPLAHMPGLQDMARAQAVRMAQRGDIYHNPNLSADITALGVNWQMVGENVGMGPTVDLVYQALLKSPHHYENITRSNYTSIGVGEVNGPGDRVYLVQVFAQITPSAKSVVAPVHVTPKAAAVHTAPVAKPVVSRPAATPAPRRPDPNALLGGRVFTADLPGALPSTAHF